MSEWFEDQRPDPEKPEQPEQQPKQPEQTPQGWGWNRPPYQNGWQGQGGYQPPYQPPRPQSYQPPVNSYGWTSPQPPKKKKNGAAVLLAVLATVCVLCLGTALVLMMSNTGRNGGEIPGTSQNGPDSTRPTRGDVPSIVTAEPEEEGLPSREIVAKNLDSTVVIRMFAKVSSYFSQTPTESQVGEATGIVWTKDGYIITNAHCVFDEDRGVVYDRIEVELYDGTLFEKAEIVGYDTTTDLAVIRVESDSLIPAAFGDSDALQLGDRVLALGNNSGLGWTVTGGMVSGLARDVYEETNYAIKCLQVDAVINPGNSGGPLLNSSGQVVGINSAKIVASGYEGLGFSIPINEASVILQNLVEYGYVKGRIMLGIEGNTYDRYSGYEGFYISAIREDSCLKGTRAQVGDIITHIDGVRVKSYGEMREQLTSHKVGETISITLIRINRTGRSVDTFDITVTLMESDGTV